MEFLVDMVTTVPDGTTEAEVDAIRIREAARSRELAAQGHLLRLWRPPLDAGEWRTWGLFQAAGATELESVLSSMPLRVWRHGTVTPLTAHPSDPDSGDVMSNQASTPRNPRTERWSGARLPHCRLRLQRPRHPHRVPQCDHPPGRRRLADRPLPGVAPRLRSQR